MKPIAEGVKPFGAAWWQQLGEMVVLQTKTLIERGVGADGAFPAYDARYAKAKSEGKYRRQSSNQAAPPNLTLTGDMLRDFKVISPAANMATIGFTVYGARVRGNAEGGRPVSSDANPLNPQVARRVRSAVGSKFREQLNRTRGATVIRVGKK